MDTIYDTLAKLNKVANAPEIVKEDSNALMKKGLEDLMKKTKFNKDADYKPFGKGDKDYEDGLSKDAKKDKMFDDMAAADASKMNKQSTYTPFSDKQSPDGLPEKKKDDKMFEGPGGQSKHELIRQLFKTHFGQPQYNELTGGRSGMRRLKIITGTSRPGYTAQPVDTSDFEKAIGRAGLSGDVRVKSDKDGYSVTVLYPDQFRMQALEEADLVEKESDVERDDRAEKAGREVKRDAKYDHYHHAGRDGKSVTKDIEYDEKHDKDGMHEAQGYDDKEDESLGMRTGKESDKKQSMKDRRDDSYGKFGKRDKEHADGKMHEADKTMVKGPDGKMVPDYAVDGKGKNDMKEDEIAEISNKTIDSYMDKVGQEDGHEQDMETASSKRGKGIDLATAKQLGNAKVKATENSGTLKDAARQGVMARLAELAGLPAQEIEEALGTPQDIANKIMSENPINEASVGDAIKHAYDSVYEFVGKYDDAALEYLDDNAPTFGKMFEKYEDLDVMISNCDDATCKIMADELYDVADELESGVLESVEEGNEFSGERDKAIKAGKNDFTVDGKTYPVKGDKNESLEESDIDQIAEVGKVYPKIAKLKMKLVDDGMEPEDAHDEACEKYDVDPAMCDKYIEMQRDSKEGTKKESKELDEGAVKDMMQDVEEGMDKKEFEKKYPGQDYDAIKKDIEDRMDEGEEKVEETTGSGAIADGAGAGKPLYKNASVYESNDIVKRAMQLNEDMSVTVSAGTDAEPNININASGEDAAKMAELCKLAGIGMMGMGSQPQSPYGEVEIQVAEDQEFANGADDQNTMDTEYMTQDIAGGLNGPKKMAYPKVAGGDNPMSVLGESELNEVGEERLMKLYQEYKAN